LNDFMGVPYELSMWPTMDHLAGLTGSLRGLVPTRLLKCGGENVIDPEAHQLRSSKLAQSLAPLHAFGMLDEPQAARAASILISHWKAETRISGLPGDCAPQTRAEAYAIQGHWQAQSAQALAGWKIAATSVAGQKHIGVDGPLAGRYISERLVPSGGHIPFGRNHMKVAEIEFAFRLATDMLPRATPYSEDEVFAAVGSLHPAIEIPDSRYEKFEIVGAPQLIADNACAHWLCLGEAMPDKWRSLDLAAFSPMGRVGKAPPVAGRGANVLGSPRIAMTWLINELSQAGITARAGEVVTTGTCVVPMAIAAGDHVWGDFGNLGQVEVTMD
jgi:2-keto-4-pentenoate hydratase